MRIKIGKLFFTSTNKSISGEVVAGSEMNFLGFIIRQRLIPTLDQYLQPTNENYEHWELYQNNHSWFFNSLYETQLKAVELYGGYVDAYRGE